MPITKIPAAGFTGNNFRNIIINGDMSIAQRSTSVASITTSGFRTVDRWSIAISALGTWTMSQSTDTPTGEGFATSLKMDCTTANASPSASDLLLVIQRFEGQNLQYLKKGTASALSLTASFWVKSTKTGTFICEIFDADNTRQISKSYTVNTTNTWEKKTITFDGDTTGVLGNDNGESLRIAFWLGAGSNYSSGTLNTSWNSNTDANRAVGQVNIADSTANDFYLTGVQLEAGTTASDFEFLPYDVNLQRCQRYYEKSYDQATYAGASGTPAGYTMTYANNGVTTTSYIGCSERFKTEKRASPTMTSYDWSGNSGKCTRGTLAVGNEPNSNWSFESATTSSWIGYSDTGSNRNFVALHWVANSEL